MTMPDDATGQEARECAIRLQHEQQFAPFDPYRDWPVQVTVIRHRGALAYRVFTLSQLIADGPNDPVGGADAGIGFLDQVELV